MAATSDSTERQIVPAWRPFREALNTGELSASVVAKAKAIDASDFLKQREDAWLENRTLPYALDLIGAATVIGPTALARQAAEFALSSGDRLSSGGATLAGAILGQEQTLPSPPPQSNIQIVNAVREFKRKRISQTRNTFVWVDLARLYLLLGQKEPARQALNVALKLAPTNRYVVRCLARFLHHIHEHEEAVDMLRKNPRTTSDTWLVAAEIAASSVAKVHPKFAKQGFKLLRDSDLLPFHKSELSSALATLEVYSGKNRSANKLFKNSLVEPTENSLAQAVWASKKAGIDQVESVVLQQSKASEAQALDALNRNNWPGVMQLTEKWAQEEAFSVRPPLLASHTAASLLDNPELAETIVLSGLSANPGHPGLVNNLAFALLLQGRPHDAFQALKKANLSYATDAERICLAATYGMAYYRTGNDSEGNSFYERAIERATQTGNNNLGILARLYHARERVLRGDKDAVADFKKAYDATMKLQETHFPAVADHMARDMEKAAVGLGIETSIRRQEKDRSGKVAIV